MYLCGLMTPFCRHSCEFVRCFFFHFSLQRRYCWKRIRAAGARRPPWWHCCCSTRWLKLKRGELFFCLFFHLSSWSSDASQMHALSFGLLFWFVFLLLFFFTPYLSWFQVGQRQDRRGFRDLFAAAVADTQVNTSLSGSAVLSKVIFTSWFRPGLMWNGYIYHNYLFSFSLHIFCSLFNFNRL